MAKRPAILFFTKDWVADPGLRRCTKAEKGVWIDMICLMHECEDYGVLATADMPWTDDEVAGAIGGDLTENLSCIAGLLRKGVVYRNQSGAIFCKRMIQDEHKRKLCSEAGKRGGNPQLKEMTLKGQVKGGVKGTSKGHSKRNPTPSFAFAIATKQKKRKDIKNISFPKEKPDFPPWLDTEDWNALVEHRKAIRRPMTAIAQKKMIEKLDLLRMQGNDVKEMINETIVNGWQGVFPLKNRDFQKGGSNGNNRTSGGAGLSAKQQREQRNHEFLKKLAGCESVVDVESVLPADVSHSLPDRGSVDDSG